MSSHRLQILVADDEPASRFPPKSTNAEQVPSFFVLSRDITERKETENMTVRLAYFDGLIGLPGCPTVNS